MPQPLDLQAVALPAHAGALRAAVARDIHAREHAELSAAGWVFAPGPPDPGTRTSPILREWPTLPAVLQRPYLDAAERILRQVLAVGSTIVPDDEASVTRNRARRQALGLLANFRAVVLPALEAEPGNAARQAAFAREAQAIVTALHQAARFGA